MSPIGLLAALLLALPLQADARQPRSAAAKAEFKRANPCPETGERRGSCKKYVVDHIIPLCSAKTPEERKLLDVSSNMQWQSVPEAKLKDREERRMCRRNQIAAPHHALISINRYRSREAQLIEKICYSEIHIRQHSTSI